MTTDSAPVYLVNAYVDPILLKIQGRANYLNCTALRKLFKTLIDRGSHHFVIDFSQCSGMDSTFLGILAGSILELRKKNPPGSITLCHLGTRNLELIRNVGLHRLLTVESGDFPMSFDSGGLEEVQPEQGKADSYLILEAHQSLVEADSSNLNKFQDVISFLKKELEGESSES